MRYLLVLPRALWKLLFALNFALGLFLLYPVFYILLSNERWFPIAFKLKKLWARWILIVPLIFVDKKIKAQKALPHPCIYCANHSSYLDIVISYIVLPYYFVFVGKAELLKAPLFKIFFTSGMDITVDRQNKADGKRSLNQAADKISKNQSIFLFPEGSISSQGHLKPFKNGAFKLAIETQTPIIPVTFKSNWKLLQNGGFLKSHGRPGIASVVIHDAIDTKGLTENDLLSLNDKVREIIASEL